MQKISSSITFTGPGCKETFEFDHVGEFQFVPCPICGTEFMTIQKGQELLLKPFEFKQKTRTSQMKPVFNIELELR
jgi:Zn finger protein HypA/HybF involved in hydrogenase expression